MYQKKGGDTARTSDSAPQRDIPHLMLLRLQKMDTKESPFYLHSHRWRCALATQGDELTLKMEYLPGEEKKRFAVGKVARAALH